jgi:hypothetical protein
MWPTVNKVFLSVIEIGVGELSMKRLLVFGLLSVLATVLMVSAASAAPVKVDVCHLNSLGQWQVNAVHENAVAPHLNHGDALPGQAVPGMSTYTFDDNCVPVAPPSPATLVLEDVLLPSNNWGRLTGSGLMPGADTFVCFDALGGCANIGVRTDASGDLFMDDLFGCASGQTGIYYYTLRADGTTITSNVEDQTACPSP